LAGHQCMGLSQKTGVTTQSACQSACCSTSGCSVFQWWPSGSSGACWIGNSGTKVTTPNCPSKSGNYVSYATKAMTSSEEVMSTDQKATIGGIVGGGVVIVVLLGALVLVLRSKARSRGKTVSQYVRESVVGEQPVITETEHLQTSPTSSALPTDTTVTVQEPTPTNTMTEMIAPTKAPTWEQRTNPDDGKVFWYNNSTGVSQWETPDDLSPTP